MNVKAVILDMDGVLYHGDRVINDAVSFIQAIQHLPHCFITNNPILIPEEVVDKLHSLGFTSISQAQIITSGQATALWLDKQKPSFRFYSVGAVGLKEVLQSKGVYDEQHADFVVVGEGAGIDFKSIIVGVNLVLNQGAQLISTNPDNSVDAVENGRRIVLPGGGALVAPFEIASGQKAITIGKPFPLLYQMALEYLQVEAKYCLMIGDRPDTDIKGAVDIGMQATLVRTGRFKVGEPLPEHCPVADWDVENLTVLQQQLFNSYEQ